MSEFRRTLGFGIVLSAVLAVLVVFVDHTADVVIFSVEKITQPCAHGGIYREDGECDCQAVWTGTYCTECACESGVCDTVGCAGGVSRHNVGLPLCGFEDNWSSL